MFLAEERFGVRLPLPTIQWPCGSYHGGVFTLVLAGGDSLTPHIRRYGGDTRCPPMFGRGGGRVGRDITPSCTQVEHRLFRITRYLRAKMQGQQLVEKFTGSVGLVFARMNK